MARIIILIFLTISISSFSQEGSNLLFMNGKTLKVINLNDSSQVQIKYEYDKNFFKKERIRIRESRRLGLLYTDSIKSEKAESFPVVLKEGAVDREDVFAVYKSTGETKHYYFQDEMKGNILTIDEMQAYITGESDARYGVGSKGWFYSGLVVGGLAGYLLESSVWTLAVPPLFSLTTQIPVVRIKENHISNRSYFGNENYALGYEKQARTSNALSALKGSAIGTVLGIAAFLIVDNNR